MKLKFNGQLVDFLPGDEINVSDGTVIVWLKDGYAEAYKLEREQRVKDNLRVIEFVENRVRKEQKHA